MVVAAMTSGYGLRSQLAGVFVFVADSVSRGVFVPVSSTWGSPLV